jgi:hypothetical protein
MRDEQERSEGCLPQQQTKSQTHGTNHIFPYFPKSFLFLLVKGNGGREVFQSNDIKTHIAR